MDDKDDLALAKGYRLKTVGGKARVDMDTMPFLKPDDPAHASADFYDLGKVIGFTMGCHKATAQKLDAHDLNFADLLKRVEALEAQAKKSAS